MASLIDDEESPDRSAVRHHDDDALSAYNKNTLSICTFKALNNDKRDAHKQEKKKKKKIGKEIQKTNSREKVAGREKKG